jgi:stage V sporulation protein B
MGLEYACAAAVIGIFFGEFLAFLYVFYSYITFKRKNRLMKRPDIPSPAMFSMILAMAVPLTLNRVTGSLLSTVENLLIPQRLEMYGYSAKEAISLFGQITGMSLPLIFFPSAILYALSTTLVPAVSEAMAVNNKPRIKYTVGRALLFTSVIGIGASTIFIVLPKELGLAIYNQDISVMLFLLGWMCPLWYMNITFSGILNGLGQQVFMFRESLISSAINIGFIFFLVPQYGLTAFIAGWFISLLVSVLMGLFKIKKCTEIEIPIANWFLKPALSAAAVGLIVEYLANHYIFAAFGELPGLIVSIALLTAGFLFCVLVFKIITVSDIQSLFKGLPLRKQQQVSSKDKSTL